MAQERSRPTRAIAALAVALALAGCTSSRTTGGVEPRAAAPAQPAPPPIDMAGRWVLASPGAGTCAMTFAAGAPGQAEGTIAPEGGCPGNFFTSRRWVFDQGALVIRNHRGEALAQLAFAAPGRFEGQAPTGEQISLAR